jgi:hypothetical protein
MRWQPLQNNLPVTPIADLAVHDKDLVVSTQGRSFWVLDDISPLHEMADSVAGAQVHLFSPRAAHRVNMAGTQDEHSPAPRPNGALLYYRLAQEPDSTGVSLEILDAQGRTVRTFTSDSARSTENRQTRLPTKQGLHRFSWDLTYAGPRLPDSVVVWGYTGGVKAPPGTYRVRITTRGVTKERTLSVLPDPRLPQITQPEYEEQLAAGLRVRDTLSAVYDAIRTIRSVREQSDAIVARAQDLERAGTLPVLADSLDGKLTAVEQSLIQTRSRSGQDPIRFAGRLDNQISELYGNITGEDGYISGGPEGRPTAGAQARMVELEAAWATLRQQLDVILTTDLARFNEAVTQAGIPPIAVRRARPIT